MAAAWRHVRDLYEDRVGDGTGGRGDSGGGGGGGGGGGECGTGGGAAAGVGDRHTAPSHPSHGHGEDNTDDHDDVDDEDGAPSSRCVKLVWLFPHVRPSSVPKIRLRFERYGYAVRAVRLVQRDGAVLQLATRRQAHDLVHGANRPGRDQFDATWWLR